MKWRGRRIAWSQLMKEIEPQLDDAMHEQVTELLCELSAYNVMQMLHSLYEARRRRISRVEVRQVAADDCR